MQVARVVIVRSRIFHAVTLGIQVQDLFGLRINGQKHRVVFMEDRPSGLQFKFESTVREFLRF